MARKEEIKVSYLVFDYYEHLDLFENVEQNGKLDEPIARFYFEQLLSAVEYLHERGLAH